MKQETQAKILDRLLYLRGQQRDEDMLSQIVRLPVKNYTCGSIFENEIAGIFDHSPLVAGHACHVREPGSYILSEWDRLPFVVVRDDDGVLRAFLNVCRHRGARLIDGQAEKLKAFVCPFHGWSYRLDGSLKSVTRASEFPGLDFSEYGLIELPVCEKLGLIWVHPKAPAVLDIDEYLGTFSDDLRGFEIDKLVSFRKSRIVKNANWKLLIKTYLEGYHVPYLHRDTLSKAFKHGVIHHTSDGPHIRLAAARTNVMDALSADRSDFNILDYASVYYVLFPNTFFIMHPDYVSINTFWPQAADRTIWTHDMLYREERFAGDAGQAALDKRFKFTNDVVFDLEDFAVAETVQQGMRFGGNEFHTLGLMEGLLAIFQQSIDRAIRPS